LNTPPDLGNVERRLVATFKEKAVDKRGDALLRRECGDVALLPEASRIIAQMVAVGLMRDLAKVLGELRSAYHPAPGEPEPDWEHVAHAVAFIAMRKAWIATHAAFNAQNAPSSAEEEAETQNAALSEAAEEEA
jgi:hypothetical protein